jgi:GxxExxY protein
MIEPFFNTEDTEDPQRTQRISVEDNVLSGKVIGAAVEVQRVLGVGLLESAYSAALALEFSERGIAFEHEVPVAGNYKGHALGVAYRADFIVERKLIVELKAIEAVSDVHRVQLLSYLRIAGLKLGLLINFHAYPLVKGVHRIAN